MGRRICPRKAAPSTTPADRPASPVRGALCRSVRGHDVRGSLTSSPRRWKAGWLLQAAGKASAQSDKDGRTPGWRSPSYAGRAIGEPGE
jgi:hypothetical protein